MYLRLASTSPKNRKTSRCGPLFLSWEGNLGPLLSPYQGSRCNKRHYISTLLMEESTMRRALWRRIIIKQRLFKTVTGMMFGNGHRSFALDSTLENLISLAIYPGKLTPIFLMEISMIKILWELAKKCNLRAATGKFLKIETYGYTCPSISTRIRYSERPR